MNAKDTQDLNDSIARNHCRTRGHCFISVGRYTVYSEKTEQPLYEYSVFMCTQCGQSMEYNPLGEQVKRK